MSSQPGSAAPRHEIAFVNGNLANLQELLAALRQDIEVVVLDPAADGLAQVAQALAGRAGVAALHLLGHGASGLLQLGDTLLDAGTLQAHADELAAIGAALAADGDILVYGCDTGAGTQGAAFVEALAQLTGADVAASDDATGGTASGGDWVLEVRQGQVGTASAAGAGAADYAGTLAVTTGPVYTVAAGTVAGAEIAAGADGHLYLAHRTSETVISLKEWTGSAWTDLGTLNAATLGISRFFEDISLKVNAAGKLDLLFHTSTNVHDSVDSIRNIVFGEYDVQAHAWSPFAKVDESYHPSGNRDLREQTLAVGPDGTLHAVYAYNDDTSSLRTYAIRYATSGDGGATWSSSVLLSQTGDFSQLYQPIIDVDDAGNVHVFYINRDDDHVDLGNVYYVTRAAGSAAWSQPLALGEGVSYDRMQVAGDGHGHFYVAYVNNAYDGDLNVTGSQVVAANNLDGSWHTGEVLLEEARVDAVAGIQLSGGKPYVLVNSASLDYEDYGLFLMRKAGDVWEQGYRGAQAPEALGTTKYSATTLVVDAAGDIVVVTEDDANQHGAYVAGDRLDFGLNAAPVVSGLDGDRTRFTPGATDLAQDGAYIDLQDGSPPVGVRDADDDAVDFNGGNITIVQSGGSADGRFEIDTGMDEIAAGPDSTHLGTALAAGSRIFVRVGAWFEIARVDATLDGQGGHGLKIVFTTADATPQSAELLIRSLMYSAPTAGVRDFALTLDDGDGGVSAPAAFSMEGVAANTEPPTVALSATRSTFIAGQAAVITFTFSEAPVGFDASDVTVTGGSIGAVSATADPKVYTATLTPTAGVQHLAGAISIGAGRFKDAAGNDNTAAGADLVFGGDTLKPVVGDASIAIAGATGSGGTFRIGDTVSVSWNDGAGGDDNGDTAGVSVDFSQFGGAASVAASRSGGVWTATQAIAAGSIDAGGRHPTIVVTDNAGNVTPHAASAGAAVDNIAPVVADADLSIAGASGSGGSYIIGDTVTATWNGGTNADVASVSFDFSEFGGGADIAATVANGVWTASYTIAAGALDAVNRNVAVTVRDDAGNATTLADTGNARVDTVRPQATTLAAITPDGTYKLGDAIVLQVTFSEAVSVAGIPTLALDTGIPGRAASYVSGSGTDTLTFGYTVQAGDLSSDLDVAGGAALQLAGGRIVDLAGNDAGLALPAPGTSGSLGAAHAIVVDGIAPTAIALSNQRLSTMAGSGATVGTLSSSDATPGDSFTYTLVGGAGAADNAAFTIAGAELHALDPAALGAGTRSVRVRTTDAAGNSHETSFEVTLVSAPTVAISSDKTAVKAGETAAITFAFSSAPSGFSRADVSVVGGTLSDVGVDAQDATVYHATFTPSADVQGVTAAVSVGAATFTDAFGADNLASTVDAAIAVDTLAPTVALAADRTVFKAGATATITFTFSEAPVGFDASDVTFSGGTLGVVTATADPRVYTTSFVPDSDMQQLAGTMSVGAARFRDAAGNDNQASTANLAFGGDTLAPAIDAAAIQVSGATGTGGTFRIGDTVTVRWSGEANTDIDSVMVDFSAVGGAAASGATYANGMWTATHAVGAGAIDGAGLHVALSATDGAGNVTTRANTIGLSLDNQAPGVRDAAIDLGAGATGLDGSYRIGDTVSARWDPDGVADVAGVSMDFSAFGGPSDVAATLVDGKWTASYTIVAATLAAGPHDVKVTVTDDAGNVAGAFDGSAPAVDAAAPAIVGIAVAGTPAASATSVEFTVTLSEAVTGLDKDDFVLARTGATAATIDSVTGTGDTYTVKVVGIAGNGSLRLDLKDGGTGIADLAGNGIGGGYTAGAVHAVSFNAAPVITSGAGLDQASVNVAEGRTAVATLAASDADHDTLAWSISGGADAALFAIDPATGALRFLQPHAWSAAQGAGNSYAVNVRVADGHGGVDEQALTVHLLRDRDGDGTPDVDDDDLDGDGRPNSIEDAVPGANGVQGDGNGDGIPDSVQLNVASLPTVVAGNPYATLAVDPAYTLTGVTATAAPGGLPRTVKMPLGQFDFTIGGVAVGGTVEMAIYVDASLKVNAYYKQDNNGSWKNIAKSVTTVGTKTRITFDLTDGGLLDSDGVANGSISDPGGVALITPQVTSNGGGTTASVTMAENGTLVTTVAASAVGAVTYSIAGGADAALFQVDAHTGVLRFRSAPDFENPLDQGDGVHDNTYVVQVKAEDASGSETQTLTVRVTDVDENPPATPPVPVPVESTVDGVKVVTNTRTNADGSTSTVISIPVVQPGRSESVGNNTVADIPLASRAGKDVLAVQVPTGYGLDVVGQSTTSTAGTSLADLIREIKAHTTAGSADQNQLVGGGSGFLGALDASAPLLVKSITPTVAAGTAIGTEPLVIKGLPATEGGIQTALVIDTRALAAGVHLELQDVDFAAIAGAAHVTGGAGSQKVWGDSASQYIMLGADDDTLHGGDGDDTVGSAGGNDHIYGDGGNDVVFGGIGDDYIDGGTGIDTVLMTGASRAGYSLRVKDGMLVSTALRGTDGIDTIVDVEVMQFAGPDLTDAGTIGRVYEAVLGRAADTAGREYWVGMHAAGVSMETIAGAIVGSSEALQQRHDDAGFVDAMYAGLLGRAGDAAGKAFWVGQLEAGTVTRAGLALQFADSGEKLAMPSSSQLDFNHSDVATLVRMYEALFERAPDEAGLNYWIGAHESGMAMRTLAEGFLASSESSGHYAGLSDAQFVVELYQVALGHAPAAAEAAEWNARLASGQVTRADVLLGIADSDEMIQLVGTVSTSIATV